MQKSPSVLFGAPGACAFGPRLCAMGSDVGLGLAQARDALAIFPLAAFLEHFEALEPLEHIPLAAQSCRCPKTSML